MPKNVNAVPTWPHLRIVGRWLSGRPLDGIARTDCSFLYSGTQALTPNGRASRWAMMPGWKRAVWRNAISLCILSVPFWVLGWFFRRPLTIGVGVGLVLALGTLAGWRIWVGTRNYSHRKHVVKPLAKALAPITGFTPAETARRIDIPVRFNHEDTVVKIGLPDGWQGTKSGMADVNRLVSQRLGGEWNGRTQLMRTPFYVEYRHRPAPPEFLNFDAVRELLESGTSANPLIGLGAESEPVRLDFNNELAHFAGSCGTGFGKSSMNRLLISQFYYHGVRDFLVCDPKQVSLEGMDALPGVHIETRVQAIWDAIALELAEMNRRYDILLEDRKATFPRRIIVLEEMNAFALETSVIWRQIRSKSDPNMAPVWNDIALLLLKARQVNINVLGQWQRMTADASGGGTFRDQFGAKLLGRFSPQAWDCLVGTRPRGTSSAIPGRAILVMGGLHRNIQVPFITLDQAIDFAKSSPYDTVPEPRPETRDSYGEGEARDGFWTPAGIGLRDAVRVGIINVPLTRVRNARLRDSSFPKPIGQNKRTMLYDATELASWDNAQKQNA